MGHRDGWEEQRFHFIYCKKGMGPALFNTFYLDQDSCAILSSHTNFSNCITNNKKKKSWKRYQNRTRNQHKICPLDTTIALPPSRKSKPHPILAPTPFFLLASSLSYFVPNSFIFIPLLYLIPLGNAQSCTIYNLKCKNNRNPFIIPCQTLSHTQTWTQNGVALTRRSQSNIIAVYQKKKKVIL